MQVSVGGSPAELLQDVSAWRRELQRGEMRPALLLAGGAHHNVPADAQLPVPCEARFFVLSSAGTVPSAVSHAVSEEPAQTQTQLQVSDRLRPPLRCVMIQRQSVRGGERHELLFGEVYQSVVFILSCCREDKSQTKPRQQRASSCVKCSHDKMISNMLVCVLCFFRPLLDPGSAEALRGLWEFRDWSFQGVTVSGFSVQAYSCLTLLCFFIWRRDWPCVKVTACAHCSPVCSGVEFTFTMNGINKPARD